MREILFRGKRIDNGEWVEGYLSKTRLLRYKDHTLQPCIDYEEKGVMLSSVVDPETIGQYTGLKDKNGIKIFGGDIIECGYSKWIAKVIWDKECARFIGIVADKEPKIVYVDMVDKDDKSAVKVIGNIHDNPELLEVKQHEDLKER